jgi:glycosyltransferase involved in cell wall biosynthesis
VTSPRTDPLVSIVTPVYNGAEYLAECVESVLAQTYENWRYTIVDNASTDATPKIAGEFARRDPRIRHLRFDEFVDATGNHNRAFEAVDPDSEFCKVVEADDWLYPECLTLMVEAASVSSTVGIVSSYQLWGQRVHLDDLPYTTTFAKGREVLRGILLEVVGSGGPTAHMLRSAFVRERQPFYERGLRHEDTEAMLWMLSRYDFAFVHQVLSFARTQPEARSTWSQTMNSSMPEKILFHLRYGRAALNDGEYRAHLRASLKRYIWWHLRQAPRLSRLRDPAFFELHDTERNLILAEANGDRDVKAAMAVIGALLFRRRLRALVPSRPAPHAP